MSLLVDTNVLLRLADGQCREHSGAEIAVEYFLARNITLFIGTQVLVEFWAVATRPDSVNGLGWSTATAAEKIRALRGQFPILAETPDVLDRWFDLVNRCKVTGRHCHDARLAALVLAHGLQRLLTYDTADFPRSWGVEAVHPNQIAAMPTN